MNGFELLTFINNNFSPIIGAVGAVVGTLITAVFLRHNITVTEFEKVKSGHFKEVIDSLLESGKMTYTEYYKANNFLKVAWKADEYYKEKCIQNAITEYDFDWFVRFFEAVGNVSDDMMQDLWARILAGKISQSSSFSYKTIDVVKNISKSDAEQFIKICSHSFRADADKYFLPNNDNYLSTKDILYSDVMRLSELGLMFNNGVTLNVDINEEPQAFFGNNSLVTTISASSRKPDIVSINTYPFTIAGCELACMIRRLADDDDVYEYIKLISEDNNNCNIEINKLNESPYM